MESYLHTKPLKMTVQQRCYVYNFTFSSFLRNYPDQYNPSWNNSNYIDNCKYFRRFSSKGFFPDSFHSRNIEMGFCCREFSKIWTSFKYIFCCSEHVCTSYMVLKLRNNTFYCNHYQQQNIGAPYQFLGTLDLLRCINMLRVGNGINIL